MFKDYQKLTELPITAEQAERMMQEAIREVRRTVIARKLISLFGPLGPGTESVPLEHIADDEPAQIDLEGQRDPSPIMTHERQRYVRVPLIYKDFSLHWRDVEWSRDMGAPLDVTNALRAAHQVGDAEDNLLINGNDELGLPGLLTCEGSLRLGGEDWRQPGGPVKDVYAAVSKLLEAQHHFPYALLTSVDMYETLLKPVKESPVLELEQINKLCLDGVHWSPQMPADTAALISTGPQNFDIAVAEDLQVAYLGREDMNYRFRMYESLVLRVKRPTAICVIKGRLSKTK